jgi:isopentenyl-diphosphate Delta-isomerase
MEKETLVIVDHHDNFIGSRTWQECHHGNGILHRAVTTLIVNHKQALLITQRSNSKKLWPGCWDASSSTHVYATESYVAAGERRLLQELGFSCRLTTLSKFQYQAKYTDVGSENEMCVLLIGRYDGEIKPDPDEVMNWKWIDVSEPGDTTRESADVDTPWLKIALEKYRRAKDIHIH